MSVHGSARVRAANIPSHHTYARRRFATGAIAGLAGHLLVALILGFLLAGGFSLTVRIIATLISCVIATPAFLSIGFALMLKTDPRPLGGGILVGTTTSTILLLITWILS